MWRTLVIEAPAAAIYAFRGTSFDGVDVLTDLRGRPRRDPGLGWCHAGFLAGAQAIWPRIESSLRDDKDQARGLYFCGHSKGGAEATLVAALALANGLTVRGLVTFGSPRVGFSRRGKILSTVEQHRRYVRGRDAVPTHPWPLWGYRHVAPTTPIGVPQHRWRVHMIAGYVADIEALDAAGDPRAAWAGAA